MAGSSPVTLRSFKMEKEKICNDSEILAMAFIYLQPDGGVYDVSEGYIRGTIFPDLDKPFLRGGDAK